MILRRRLLVDVAGVWAPVPVPPHSYKQQHPPRQLNNRLAFIESIVFQLT